MSLTKIVYLGGVGRSGTTFVSMLLSQNADCFDIGQIRDLPEGIAANRVCSCGKPMKICDFWGEVVAQLIRAAGIQALTEFRDGKARFNRSAAAIADWSNRDELAVIRTEHASFIQLTAELYRICSTHSGNTVLIDSSKLPGLGLALALSPANEVYHINLVRDPRAVCASWSKLKKANEKLEDLQRGWNRSLTRMDQIGRLFPERFMRIRYEDFTTGPRPMVEMIQRWAGLQVGTSFFTSANEADMSWDRMHLFPPANEEILRNRAGHIVIRPSESWKAEEFRRFREIAERLNFPRAEELGYSKEGVVDPMV